MVQIIPQRTNVGTQLGQSLGAGLQQGGQIGFQRGMLQNALKGIEDLPKDATPYQLASQLIQATAGIPGAERYVGQLFPLLLGQLRSDQAFQNGEGEGQGSGNQSQEGIPGSLGSSAQSNTAGLPGGKGGASGGLLGSVMPQDEIKKEAERYAKATGTGIEGATQRQQYLLNQNIAAQQQRKEVEQKAADIGIPSAEIPKFMQLAQKHKNAKTYDDLITSTERDYKEYKNLSTTLDKFSYPGAWRQAIHGPGARQDRLKKLDPQVERLVNLGFEQEVRQKLAEKQLSPTEIEERIHPLSESTQKELSSLPPVTRTRQSPQIEQKSDERLTDFLKKNINPGTSLLVLRDKLWQDKNYDWQRIAQVMGDVVKDPEIARNLTAAQQNELSTVETEAPRQSLGYIFQDLGNIWSTYRGER